MGAPGTLRWRAAMLGLAAVLTISCMACGASAADAQPIPLCLKGRDADFSIQATLPGKDKNGEVTIRSMECQALNVAAKNEEQQRYGFCPVAANYCQVTLEGSVGTEQTNAFNLGGYSRDADGTFEILGERGFEPTTTGASTVIQSDSCTADGSLGHHVVCSATVVANPRTYRWITGRCVATVGKYRGYVGYAWLDPPTHIDLQYCLIKVTPVYLPKGCRLLPSTDVAQQAGSILATEASRSCRPKKGKPVSPPKGVQPPPPLPPSFPPPSDQPPPPLHCSQDNPSDPPAPECVRVTVRVIPAPLPSDPGNESIGVGVGSATLEPGGKTIHCLNPEDAPCVLTTDVPANTPASVSAQPGSLSDDPSSPPDSAFWKFAGACTGSGRCSFTPTNGATIDVYFIPAMVTLTLKASGDEGHANMTANEFRGGGLEPAGPVYCGYTYPANPLPCKVMVRVQKFAQVEANTAGDPNITLDGFSSNCTPEAPGSSICDLRMTTDQTATAMFAAVGVG